MFRSGWIRQQRQLAALVAAPLLSLVLFAFLKQQSGPMFQAGQQDPTYAYLFNGLALATCQLPPLAVHPGATTHWIVAVFLRTCHPLTAPEELIRTVINDPELYISSITWSWAILYAITLMVCGRLVFRWTSSLLCAVMFQCAVLIPKCGAEGLHGLRPEPVIMLVGLILATTLVASFGMTTVNSPLRSAVAWGSLIGVGTASKLLFAPLIMVPLMVMDNWRHRGLLIFCAVIVFLGMTIPVWPRMGDFAAYMLASLIHSGHYGEGNRGLIELTQYLANLQAFARSDKPFFVLLVFCWAGLLFARYSRFLILSKGLVWKAMVGLGLAQGVTLLLIAKQPLPHYLTSAASMSGLMVFGAFMIIRHYNKRWMTLLTLATLLGILAIRTVALVQFGRIMNSQKNERIRLAAFVNKFTPSPIIIPYFPCSNPIFALFYGNITSEGCFTRLLTSQWPNDIFYDRFSNRFARFDRSISYSRIQITGCPVLLIGWRLDDAGKRLIQDRHHITLSNIFDGQWETVYLASPK